MTHIAIVTMYRANHTATRCRYAAKTTEEVAVFRVEQLPEGTQFRLARIAAGMTLFEVGKRADVSPPRLSEFERGLPSLSPDAVARVRTVLAGADPSRERKAVGVVG
jgi:hypothetical protein